MRRVDAGLNSKYIVVRPSVVVTFADRGILANHFLPLGSWGGLFIAGEIHLDVGADLDVEIVLMERKVVLHTRAMVRWRRPSGTVKIPAGIGVEFLDSEQRAAQMIAVMIKDQEPPRLIPRGRRYPAMVTMAYTRDHTQSFLPCITDDISREGAFLMIGDDAVNVGDMLYLRIWNPKTDASGIVQAKVIWRGGRGARRGVGIRFEQPEPSMHALLDDVIGTIAQQTPPLPEGLATMVGA